MNKIPKNGFLNIIIAIIVVMVLAGAGYFVVNKKSDVKVTEETATTTQVEPNENNESPSGGQILSFEIDPSIKAQGWIMYRDGAKVILKGKNLKSVEVKYFSTGTDMPDSFLAGRMDKTSESLQGDTWELKLPIDILATSFWAEAEDSAGKKIKSSDLGNVGYK